MTGRYFNFMTPEQSHFDINDVAHALSNICRFCGHTQRFYSVAQHSVYVSMLVPPEDALAGLLHDASEAFVGDVAKPLKRLLPDYSVIEARVERAVFERFGLPHKLPVSVKIADRYMLHVEQRDLMAKHDDVWEASRDAEESAAPLPVDFPDRIIPMLPDEAKVFFLQRYEALTRSQLEAFMQAEAQ
jgi:5'-deoxynucleotidase YfbR-like HD superfamily hydrolase